MTIKSAASAARFLAVLASAGDPAQADLFREMCIAVYNKPPEDLTWEELIVVQKALQDAPAEPPAPVYELPADTPAEYAQLATTLAAVWTQCLSAGDSPESGRVCDHHWPGRKSDEKGWCGRCGLGASASGSVPLTDEDVAHLESLGIDWQSFGV